MPLSLKAQSSKSRWRLVREDKTRPVGTSNELRDAA
jgi:hypothetical protein